MKDVNKPVSNRGLLKKNVVLYEGIRAFRTLYMAEYELWWAGTIQLPLPMAYNFVPCTEVGLSEPYQEWFPILTEKRNEISDDEG